MHNLTPKQFLWCEYFLRTLNATRAAELAEYKGSYSVLAVTGHDNLKKPKIRAYLNKRWKEITMSTDEVLARLAKIASTVPSDYINKGGGIDWDKVNEDGYAVKSITHTKGKQSKLEFEGRLRALELIGKAQAMFTDKIEIVDWREELQKAGGEPAKIFEEMVKRFVKVQSDASD